jgi:tetratricopeptide (TPR) repeat protein
MPSNLVSYSIFIASPSGLDEERKTFKTEINEYNDCEAHSRGVHFEPVGWEETLGGVGRPQELINEEIKKSDYFILLLWDRWGSPTGKAPYTSGTHEEYQLAIECQKDVSAYMRQIVCFFKSVDPRQLADPGEQLKKVIEFKKERQTNKDLLYHEFDTTKLFQHWLRKYLAQWVIDHEKGKDISPKTSKPPLPIAPQDEGPFVIVDKTSTDNLTTDQANVLKEAQSLANQGKLVEAEEIFSKIAISTNAPEAIKQYGIFLLNDGRLKQSETMVEKLFQIGQTTKNDHWIADSCRLFGIIYRIQGDLKKAEEMLLKASDLFGQLGDQNGLAQCLVGLGQIYRLGNFKKSEELLLKAIEIFGSLGDEIQLAIAHESLGTVYRIKGELEKSEKSYRKALELYQALNNKAGIGNMYGGLGNIFQLREQFDQAVEMYQKSIEIDEALGRNTGLAGNYSNLAIILRDRGDIKKAKELTQKALELKESLGELEGIATCLNQLGVICLMEKEYEKAEEMFTKSLGMNERLGSLEGLASNYGNLGLLFERKGEVEKTEEMKNKILKLAEQHGSEKLITKIKKNFES